MRRIIVSIMLCLVLASCIFANPKTGLSLMLSDDPDNEGRFAVEFGDQTIWHFGEEGQKTSFCLVGDVSAGLAFASYNNEPHVHLDFHLGLLPGLSILITEGMNLNICAGLRYGRTGYSGNLEDANDYDKTLSILTLGVMGSHPTRKIDLALDIDLDLGFLSAGIIVGYPFIMLMNGHQDGFYASIYGAMDI